jgi:hypothetical protein
MPLDFTNPTTKPAALAAYTAACETPDLADWQAIAAMLAQHLQPKARAPKIESAGEWCEYTQSQRSGRGGAFHASRRADFLFADGTVITVSLCHKMTIAAPDWARAARCAVSYYKAKRAHMVLRALNEWEFQRDSLGRRTVYVTRHKMAHDSRADLDSRSMPVPEIVEAVDVTRNVLADLARCNAATIRERNAA